jgi:undecaprenyl-diphosphatase
MTLLQTIIISIIEGITEFLPISSTGHMILASAAMGIHENEFVKSFEIIIQLGAIMAIVLLYYKRFLQGIQIYLKLFTAFLPTAIIGFFAYSFIKAVLFNPIVVSVSLIVGGILLIIIDKQITTKASDTLSLEEISYGRAFRIGLIQCFSMIPGTSRAAATIIGGVFNGLDKKQATEFSFLLAVPTMFAATAYDLYKTPMSYGQNEYILLAVGLIISFITAWLAVKVFLKIVENFGFKHFGYYRIVLGIVFLTLMYGTSLPQ